MTMNPAAKRWLKRLGWGALSLFALLCLVLGGLLWALHTQWGRDRIVVLVNEKASSGAMTIRLEGLQSVMPWDLRLGSFSLADADGVWLSGSGLDASVDVPALLGGAITCAPPPAERRKNPGSRSSPYPWRFRRFRPCAWTPCAWARPCCTWASRRSRL